MKKSLIVGSAVAVTLAGLYCLLALNSLRAEFRSLGLR
jgi:hypothetical protein